jgi:hypothetical protein
MWVIDINDWLDKNKTGPGVFQLKYKVERLAQIITYATSKQSGLPKISQPTCWRKPKRKPCSGILKIEINSKNEIHWECPACNDEGVVSGWRGLIWDMLDISIETELNRKCEARKID